LEEESNRAKLVEGDISNLHNDIKKDNLTDTINAVYSEALKIETTTKDYIDDKVSVIDDREQSRFDKQNKIANWTVANESVDISTVSEDSLLG
jgi:hypothetical protein